MKKINKVILFPLLSAIALFIKQVWGVEVPVEAVDFATNGVLYAIFFLGLFINPKKKGATKNEFVDPDATE